MNNRHANAIEQNDFAQEDTVISCRYELKYRIPETKARAVTKYIMAYINPDRYSIKCADYAYPVSSLYFDSENLHLCNETIQGRKNRFKLRIRCYDDDIESPCFFEIKRRINNIIHKDRARLSKQLVQKTVHENYVQNSLCKREQDTLRQFQFYLQILRGRPIVLIRYMRQAFEENAVNRVRITFDRELSFKAVSRPEVTLNGTGWQPVPIDFVILEIKFTSKYPLWLSTMVKIFDLEQSAMSKYVSSVQQSCMLGFCAPECLIL
ncbi:MAG: polyphosphate polymerase domain-containing protein [Sedimentisphaerales bacterium]|nr:polyphosphate polymerase domain-containing protein [Sedimentisphaerales bacterium]